MSLLSQYPHREVSGFIEGVVVSVDQLRSNCAVKTVSGLVLPQVLYLTPSEESKHGPKLGARVFITTAPGYPIILGYLPRIGPIETQPSISNVSPSLDPGSHSYLSGDSILDPNKPNDLLPGDNALVTGGSILGLLRSGTIIAKASSLAQIIVSKLGHLVKIVGLNYYRFSGASSRVSSSKFNRLYEWFGSDRDLNRGKANLERYNEVYGDVAAGEQLRGEPDSGVTLADRDDRVRRYWLKNTAGDTVMVETLFEGGKLEVVVNTAGSSSHNSTVTQDNQLIESAVVGDKTSVVTITPDSIVIDYDSSDSVIELSPSGIKMDSQNHYCYINSSGVQMG